MLKETEQYENTIVVFISDNGANRYGNNGNLRGFKGGVYEGGSRVPAIFSYPGIIKKRVITLYCIFLQLMLLKNENQLILLNKISNNG
jgi:arylsulfatase A-like enzyme